MRAPAVLRRPEAESAAAINARILGEIEHAAFDTRYRLADFASIRGRNDLASVHRFFARRLDNDPGEVLAALETFLVDRHCLGPYIHSGTATRNQYLRDLAELALALASSLETKIC